MKNSFDKPIINKTDHIIQGGKDMKEEKEKASFMEKVATFIVDKRKGLFLAFIGAAIFCAFSFGWVSVNNDITTYLPDSTETRQGLTIMGDEFITYGTAIVMVDNISYEQAEEIDEAL